MNLSSFQWEAVVKRLLIVGLFSSLAGCSQLSESAAPPSNADQSPSDNPAQTLVLGDISADPTLKVEQYQPLANYLAAQMADSGIKAGRVKIAPDMDTMMRWLQTGEVDLYFDSPYPVMRIQAETSAQPILRRWKKGVAEYHTVIFAMQTSPVQSLADLPGHLISLDSPYSTTGYLLPMVLLKQAGLTLTEKASIQAAIAPTEIGYVFSQGDENTVEWVINGDVAAGAVDSGTFSDLPAEVSSQMQVLAVTEAVPRHLAVVSATLSPQQVDRLKALLTNLDDVPEGESILEQFEETTQFDEIPAEMSLDYLQSLYQQIQAE
ncbi:MAG: phosphate/phosphite/phosphonate ABC transporter substrate-binding protein [Almyronema sp.]